MKEVYLFIYLGILFGMKSRWMVKLMTQCIIRPKWQDSKFHFEIKDANHSYYLGAKKSHKSCGFRRQQLFRKSDEVLDLSLIHVFW